MPLILVRTMSPVASRLLLSLHWGALLTACLLLALGPLFIPRTTYFSSYQAAAAWQFFLISALSFLTGLTEMCRRTRGRESLVLGATTVIAFALMMLS